jgi:hypothetical protein
MTPPLTKAQRAALARCLDEPGKVPFNVAVCLVPTGLLEQHDVLAGTYRTTQVGRAELEKSR